MDKQIGVFHLLVAVAAVGNASEPQQTSLERWDRAVCLQTERKATDGLPSVASAFVVAREDNLYLVTAAHAAQDTHTFTKVLYRSAGGESRWVHLGGLVDASADPWRTHKNTDIAFLLIKPTAAVAIYVNDLKELAIPFAAADDSSKSDVVGMYIGLIADASGAKLSKVIPSRVIRTAIEQHASNLSQQSK